MSSGGSYKFCPGAPSLTAMKYLKTYIPNRQFMPGERYRHYRNMEEKVPGFRDINRELRCVSEEIEHRRYNTPDRELSPAVYFRNSAVGYTSSRGTGNQWNYSFYPSSVTFSGAGASTFGLNAVYRYYGKHRYA